MGILNGYDRLGRANGPMLNGFMLDQRLNLGYYTSVITSLLALLILVMGSRIKGNKRYDEVSTD